jgi:hypothetical protein
MLHSFLNKSITRVVLNQTFLRLTEFIKKSTNIYDTKLLLLLLDTLQDIFS